MSQVIASKSIAVLTLLGAGIGFLRTLRARIVRKHKISRQRQMLYAMPYELLQDVGLNYSDIDELAERMIDGQTDPARRPQGVFYE